jgi:hypothetical protein
MTNILGRREYIIGIGGNFDKNSGKLPLAVELNGSSEEIYFH